MKTPSSQPPPNSSSENSSPKTPLWETLVIAASFIGVWIYFLAWIFAGQAKTPLSNWWQFLLVPCLVALIFVFRRRLARAKNTVHETGRPRFGR